jgi:hypothetical protein
MAPLPPENTPRFKIFYTVGGRQHVQQVRTGVMSPSAFGTLMDEYYTELDGSIYETTIDDVQFAADGSNIFNSVTTGIENNTYGTGTAGVEGEDAYFYDFIGRSSGGRRVRFTQFGAKALGSDYRFSTGDDPNLDDALAVIDGATSAFVAIDGVTAVWKSYINAGVNAYWQRNIRP